ncbi:MAG: DNA polymerase III subunit beta [Patescibacteria group bacterium]
MRVLVKRKDFLNLLSGTSLITIRETQIPMLEHILLVVEKDELKGTVSNLEQYLIKSCKVTTEGEGKICVRPGLLEKFLKLTKGEKATLAIHNNKLSVQVENASLILEGLSSEDFPKIPQVEGKSIKVSGLLKALKGIAYAMAKSEFRPALCGVCFSPCGNRIELAATDGSRLVVTTIEADNELPYQFILPAKMVQIILKLKLDEVVIRTGKEASQTSYVAINKDEELTLISFTIQAEYPNYKPFIVIPKEAMALKVKAEELRKGLVITSSLLTSSRFKTVSLRVEEGLILSSEYREMGRVSVKMDAEGIIAALNFNEKYLKDVLDRVEGEIILYTTGSEKPLSISYQDFLHVLMPCRR